MEGALADQIRLRASEGVELVSALEPDRSLCDTLGLESAVLIERRDGGPLAGIGRLLDPA
jgi:hypothetical protein